MENTMEVVENEVFVSPTKQLLLEVEVPATTRTWKPVSHRELIEVTLEAIDKCGFELRNELYTAGNGGLIANGKYHLNYGDDPDMGLMVAWQNSYNKQLSLKLGVGSHVFICKNGLIVGDTGTFKSKHIGDIQQITPEKIREYICRAGDNFQQMVIEKAKLREQEVSHRLRAELLGRMLIEDSIITSTQLNIIRNEIKKPTHDYGYQDSAWELLNYVTFAQKSMAPDKWMQKSMDTHTFFIEEFVH